MNTRSAGVQYMKNNPERFIESSTDHSWLRCLVYISHQGTEADALVIQAAAYALNLTIHVIGSHPGFASATNIGTVRSETDTTVMSIGHLDEIHYVQVLTVLFNQSTTKEAPKPNYLDPKCTADSLIHISSNSDWVLIWGW